MAHEPAFENPVSLEYKKCGPKRVMILNIGREISPFRFAFPKKYHEILEGIGKIYED